MKNLLYFAMGCFYSVFASEAFHDVGGTNYGKEGAVAYALNRHGPDGSILLDPYFVTHLENLEGKRVLDAGCGAAPWAIYAAERGAEVFGIDIQKEMIEQALAAIHRANLAEKVTLAIGDVALLPCSDKSFDLAISINVGCNLPSSGAANGKSIGLGPHLKEMRRVLKEGGQAILTAPTSFSTIFTNGCDHATVLEHISTVLAKLPENPIPAAIISELNNLKEIYRATFVIEDNRLVLVTDESQLMPGQDIWRKLPGITVPNRYHSEEEYRQEIAEAGFKVKKCFSPRFSSKEELITFNYQIDDSKRLGDEYIDHSPFLIFYLE